MAKKWGFEEAVARGKQKNPKKNRESFVRPDTKNEQKIGQSSRDSLQLGAFSLPSRALLVSIASMSIVVRSSDLRTIGGDLLICVPLSHSILVSGAI